MSLVKSNLIWILFIISVPLFTNAQIISGTDTLKFNCNTGNQPGINFSTGIISYNPNKYFSYTSVPCTLSSNGMDCFVDIAIPNCECPPASTFHIVSLKPFYKSKIDFNSLNFRDSLAINDTVLFNKIDTARNQSDCWLPSILFSYVTNTINLHDSTILIKTSFNKYVLVQINPITSDEYLYCTDKGNWFFYLHGIILTWYLQANGSLDFSGVDPTGINPISNKTLRNSSKAGQSTFMKKCKIGFSRDVIQNKAKIFYSIKGERLIGVNLNKMNGLVVYK